MSATREYKGWTIERVHPSGYWKGTNYGVSSPLMADTLAGLKQYITHVMNGGKR